MFAVGVVLLILQRTGSAALAGATIAAATFPAIVAGPLIGAWLDRSGRRSLLYKVDRLLLAACLLGIIALTGHAPTFVIPLLAFITGMTQPASFGGFTSMIPLIVEDDLVAQANAVEAASFNLALVIGPAIAGVLATVSGPAAALWAEIGLTLVALALTLRIPGLNRGGSGSTESLARLIATGLRLVAREPVLRAVTFTGVVNMVGTAVFTVAFPLWAAGDLGASRNAGGYLWAAFALGSLVGALGLARIQSRHRQDTVFFVGLAAFALLMLTWPLAGSLAVALVVVAVAAVPEGPALSATFTLRAERTPDGLVSQVMTTLGSLKVGAYSIGAAIAGPLVVAVGPRMAIVISAVFQLLGVAVGVALDRWWRPGAASPAGRPSGALRVP